MRKACSVQRNSKTDNSNDCKTLYNTQFYTQNGQQIKFGKLQEVTNITIKMQNGQIGENKTQKLTRQLNMTEDPQLSQQRKAYLRKRVNTSYIVYPIENTQNLLYQKEQDIQPKLMYRVSIPDVMKIPHLQKKNQRIKNQLQKIQQRQDDYLNQDDIRITSRVSFHNRPRQSIYRMMRRSLHNTHNNINEQLKVIINEHQSTEQSFIQGWE